MYLCQLHLTQIMFPSHRLNYCQESALSLENIFFRDAPLT